VAVFGPVLGNVEGDAVGAFVGLLGVEAEGLEARLLPLLEILRIVQPPLDAAEHLGDRDGYRFCIG
jgi:hypothetical protein